MTTSPAQALSRVRFSICLLLRLRHNIEPWVEAGDVTLRLIRAMVVACRAEPAINAWYDSHAVGRRVLEQIHLGIAVDTEDGLFVPVLRDVANRDPAGFRKALEALREAVRARTIAPEDLRGYTICSSRTSAPSPGVTPIPWLFHRAWRSSVLDGSARQRSRWAVTPWCIAFCQYPLPLITEQ